MRSKSFPAESDYTHGSMRRREENKYEYRFSYLDEYDRNKRKSFYGADPDDLLEKADEFVFDISRKKVGIDKQDTIYEIVKYRYDADLEKNYVGEQGYCRNMGTLNIIKKSAIGHIPIVDLRHQHIDLFLRGITHYSNSTISKLYQQIRMAFEIAFERGVIKHNIMTSRDLRCPKSDKPIKKVRGFTEEEQKIFEEGLINTKVPRGRNNYKMQLMIELYSGMRMGEINALKPENIDFENKMIKVRHTVSRGIGYRSFIKEGTKTYAGVRNIPMNATLEAVLREAVKAKKKNKENLIFFDYNKNRIIETTQVNCYFRRICEKLKLEYNGQHALRHTFATRCIEAGVPAVVLKGWLGHTDIHITLDTYADVFSKMNFEAAAKLDEHCKGYWEGVER